ncbi:hypothetical protein ALI144C_51220 [Actinosynnema sp. ALI-1.44]|uniref:WD40/YVTN/BNR-like repeat-containing protein n=1 Tax=Actinosynnema sp. ALI-1.44 TaxID=1933779 RepID=UPI00097BA8E8|nr:hypothetical protein [Actinosynnema sp. ALI-1.44]ONI70949.1 hypothetical protein ALI144C_51220 [Actinosynnema sp. ALI-1.44]
MPDLDFDGLRTDLRDAVRQPPVDDVIARARHRSKRRRTQIVSVAAVFLAAAVVPLVRLGVQRDTAPPLDPSDVNQVVSLDFYDSTHGYALGRRCESVCEGWLMASVDGMTWERRVAPPTDLRFSERPDRLITLGASRVVIEDYSPSGAVKRLFSGDGARTWQQVPAPGGIAPVATIPGSSVLDCADGAVNVLLPDTGGTARLTHQPPFDVTSCDTYPDQWKRWWVAGRDRATGNVTIASSKNGEQWTLGTLPLTAGPPRAISIAASPTAVYAVEANAGETPTTMVAIFRSNDNGVTWERTWPLGAQPVVIAGVPVAGTDGKLRISGYPSTSGESWVSADGGKTFTAEPSKAAGEARRMRTGYVVIRPDGRALISPDGVSWWDKELPVA